MNKDYKKIAEVAALAGRILLESHAESYRVEDTVRRILGTSGLDHVEVYSNATGLFLTLDDSDPDFQPITLVLRITERGNHMNKIVRVNNISRSLTSGKIGLDVAYERLQVVDESEYDVKHIDLATILMVVAFTLLFSNNVWDYVFGFVAGIVVAWSRIFQEYLGMNNFIYGATTTFLTVVVVHLCNYLIPQLGLSTHYIIIAAFMPLYPGTAFMNALRDSLKGDYNSGLTRLVDAFVIAFSLALGVACGLFVVKGLV